MPYSITNRRGNVIANIPDGTINSSSTYLNLPGPNFVGYGSYLNENLISLLENFAGPQTPSGHTPLEGQLWYDTYNQNLNVYTANNGFVSVNGMIVSGTQPFSQGTEMPANGQLWFNTATNQLNVYDGENSTWNLIGPSYTKSMGPSGAVPTTVADANIVNLYHNIVQIQYGGTIMAILSSDHTFSPSPSIPGFPVINPGITLNNYNGSEEFVGNIIGNIIGNVSAHRITSDGYFFANGDSILTYSNSNVASFLTTSSTILGINSSIAGANDSIITANTAAVAYINDLNTAMIGNITTLYGNTGSLQNQISAITSSMGPIVTSYLAATNYANTLNSAMAANVTSANTNIASLTANFLSNISSINANIVGANTAIVTANTAMKSYVDSFNTVLTSNAASQQTSINAINSNVTAANVIISTLQSQIYSNANTSAYLPQYAGNITANRITTNAIISSAITNTVGNLSITPAIGGAVAVGSLLRLFSASATSIALLSPQSGDIIFNTTYNKFQGYANGTWGNITLT